MNRGIYIGVRPYGESVVIEKCTTNDYEKQREEAGEMSRRTGCDKIFWFQKPPVIVNSTQKSIAEWAVRNGYLVYSEKMDG